MQIVIDANVIMAMLIKPGIPTEFLLKEEIEIFAPELIIKEIENNKQIIKEKTGLDDIEIDNTFSIIKKRIKVIPEEEFIYCLNEAENISPDPKDIHYFALAIHLKCPMWTNEKKLKEQFRIRVYSTHELIEMFKH